jgi:hypothetical protein
MHISAPISTRVPVAQEAAVLEAWSKSKVNGQMHISAPISTGVPVVQEAVVLEAWSKSKVNGQMHTTLREQAPGPNSRSPILDRNYDTMCITNQIVFGP